MVGEERKGNLGMIMGLGGSIGTYLGAFGKQSIGLLGMAGPVFPVRFSELASMTVLTDGR